MDKQENIEEFYQRKYGWMPDNIRKVALGWLLAKKPWIVPIPGTTKAAHLQENLMAAGLQFTAKELNDFDGAISKIKIHGDRYTAEEQKRVER